MQQGWLLLGEHGIIAPPSYKEGTAILGFAVTIGVVPIDGNCTPIGKPKPFQMADLLDVNAVSSSLGVIFKGEPNSRLRAITFWVADRGSGQVQSDNIPSSDKWDEFMHMGTKSPPVSLLEHCQMVEPHLLALVYEFEKTPIEKTWHSKSHGEDVQTHLMATGLWQPLGLK